jgi:heme o synthase
MTQTAADTTDLPPTRKRLAEWKDYFDLLKPRVMSLVVFTALAGYLCAPSDHNPVLGAIAIFAIGLGGGAAGALNMWYDADIDGLMKRTQMRPIPAGLVNKDEALAMGLIMSFVSIILLALTAKSYLAAGLLAFTIFFYAVVYSMWLKRSTPQNIVIGGLAGALPPLVGWAAASGDMPLNAWLLVAIIFLWTPPHSWALALYKSGDYAAAQVPMMPVAKGAKSTRLQMLLYSLVLVPVAIAPVFTGLGGVIYGGVSLLMGKIFLLLAWRVYRSNAGDEDGREEGRALYSDKAAGNRPARDLFAFSLLYLTGLFAALLLEHGLGLYMPFTGFGL